MQTIHAFLVKRLIEVALIVFEIFSFYEVDTIQSEDASENALKSWHS